jgi:DNA-binding transcriptional ArsR family regulator
MFRNMSFKSSREVTAAARRAKRSGESGDRMVLSDPSTIRALAHPARVAILERLILDGPRTATECSADVGLSPSACSYHLRVLARSGYVEEDSAAAINGRERPWRARVVGTRLDEPTDAETAKAAQAFRRVLDEHWLSRRRQFLASEASYPSRWRSVSGTHQSVVYLTPTQLESLRKRVWSLIVESAGEPPEHRSPKARPVQLVFDAVPIFAPEAQG